MARDFIQYEFGVNEAWDSAFDVQSSHIKRLKKLIALEEAPLMMEVCRHYLTHFIPTPVEHEGKYWIMSCFPSTDHSPVRVSIWFPEVFHIAPASSYLRMASRWQCLVFVHSSYLDSPLKTKLQQKIPGLHFSDYYRFQTGIPEQLAVFMPLESYFDFVEEDAVYESIRAHNYELTLKGKTPFKRGHNPEFVRCLFGDHRILSEG